MPTSLRLATFNLENLDDKPTEKPRSCRTSPGPSETTPSFPSRTMRRSWRTFRFRDDRTGSGQSGRLYLWDETEVSGALGEALN